MEDITHLAVVALKVVVLVHRHDPEDLLAALGNKTKSSNNVWNVCIHFREILHAFHVA